MAQPAKAMQPRPQLTQQQHAMQQRADSAFAGLASFK